MSQERRLTEEDFDRALEAVYRMGGNPEYVIGRCPHCKAVFEYDNGKLLHGHYASECPERPNENKQGTVA